MKKYRRTAHWIAVWTFMLVGLIDTLSMEKYQVDGFFVVYVAIFSVISGFTFFYYKNKI